MNNEDLKRLITQYEQWQSTNVKNFDDDDVLNALRELLEFRTSLVEISEIIDNTNLV
jgi:hypothetical protein